MDKRRFLVFIFIGITAACTGQSKTGAAVTVEQYYQAMTERNDTALSSLACADWEEQALLEYDSFQGVTIALDGISCSEAGVDGEYTLVECTGKIAATYGNEKVDFPLDDRVHRMKNESGDWRVCGY